jgi:heme-degrading monooxygenase HmoA
MDYAAVVEVDNSREDPEAGRRGLRQELAPALGSMPGFVSAHLLTAYERGRGMAVVVFDSLEAAEALVAGLPEGRELRDGVVVTRVDVLEVTASA